MFIPWLITTALGTAAYYAAKWLWRKLLNRVKKKAKEVKQAIQDLQSEMAAENERRRKEENARQERERREREEQERRELEAKEAKVKEILKSDSELAKQLIKMGGLDPNRSPEEILNDPELVRKMARQLHDQNLEMLRIAASQNDIEFNLEKKSERSPVPYPTSDIESVLITNVDQLPSILPEELVHDDETFYRKLADQELLGLQSFEHRIEQKLLYILYDASPSMDELMKNGLPRHIWARGVILNLLIRAVRGEAKYFLRPFASYPMNLIKVVTQDEAAKLIETLSQGTPRDGGTSIMAALEQAAKDIRTLGGEVSQADILLISDGEDEAMKNTKRVKEILGEDIKLRVALIGHPSDYLKAVATSYRVFQ